MWRALKSNKLGWVGSGILFTLFFTAFFAPYLAPSDPNSENLNDVKLPPGSLNSPLFNESNLFLSPETGINRLKSYPLIIEGLPPFEGFSEVESEMEIVFLLNELLEGKSFYSTYQVPFKDLLISYSKKQPYLGELMAKFSQNKGENFSQRELQHLNRLTIESVLPDLFVPFKKQIFNLGTDELGRDLKSRLIYGARISLRVGFISVFLALLIGVPLGAISGFYGGWLDLIIMRLMDVLLAFPGILLAITIVTILEPSLDNAIIAVGLVGIPVYTRLVRASVLSIKEMVFVDACRSLGASDGRILFLNILPNCMGPIIVQSTLSTGTAILEAASLSFLGLGAQPPLAEWGAMLAAGFKESAFLDAGWIMLYPGLAIMFTVLGFNLLGDALRDALDPRLRRLT